MQIYKQNLPYLHGSSYRIMTSAQGELLSIKEQQNAPVAYYTILPGAPVDFSIEVIAFCTGRDIFVDLTKYKFINTLMLENGEYVVHYYQKVSN